MPGGLPRVSLPGAGRRGGALAGCAEEPLAPLNARFDRSLAETRLDPEAAVAALTAYRASHGLGPVRLEPALTVMAQRQADAMVAANELSHTVAGSFSVAPRPPLASR